MNFEKGDHMGGVGSGRLGRSERRALTTDFMPLDVRALARLLDFRFDCDATCTWTARGKVVGSAGMKVWAGVLVLTYQFVGSDREPSKVAASAPLVWSRCTLGGERPWLLCPGEECGRRVAVLYCGVRLLCRRCLGLAYPSQRESAPARAHRRGTRLRQDIEQRGGSLDYALPVRPPGMHRQTFLRLHAAHEYWMTLYFIGEAQRLETMLKRLGSM